MTPTLHLVITLLLALVAIATEEESTVEKRSGTLAAIAINPSQYFDGSDGSWSSFGIQVGTPPQQLQLLPSTAQNSIWVVDPAGCVEQYGSDCSSARGTEFINQSSSTWEYLGLYSLLYEGAGLLGYVGNAYTGFDDVMLGWPGSGAPSVKHEIIQSFAAPYPYLGMLGLVPRAVNFTSLNNQYTSLMNSLMDANLIPSLSYGYTAGAAYRDPQVFGSLTLGGYDTTRFTPNNLSVPFGADNSRDLLVGVQSITSNSTDDPLMSSGIMALVESGVSTIWLPISACEAFERAFNLTWNSTSELYFLDNSTHTTLQVLNPTITFKIGSTLISDDAVNIVLPYASFDLQAGLPIVDSPTWYFPLQRAANQTQYTLGRTFLQEAYIIVDYERGNFSVAQAQFPSTAVGQNLITILPTTRSTSPSSSIGAIVGGVVGGVVIIGIIGLAVFLFRRRSCKVKSATKTKDNQTEILHLAKLEEESKDIKVFAKAELEDPGSISVRTVELLPVVPKELHHEPKVYCEMEGSSVQPVEKPGDEAAAMIDRRYSFEGMPTESHFGHLDGRNNPQPVAQPPRKFSFDPGAGTFIDVRETGEGSYVSGLSGSTFAATEAPGDVSIAGSAAFPLRALEKEENTPRDRPLDNNFLVDTVEDGAAIDSLPRYDELTRDGSVQASGLATRVYPEKDSPAG